MHARIFTVVLAGIALLLLQAGSSRASLTATVPAYFYPGTGGTQGFTNGWDQLNAAAGTIPVQAIVDPASGPGSAVDPNYTNVVNNLIAAGGQAIGYTYTDYGFRSLTGPGSVEADITQWLNLYPNIQGIFLDQMSTDPSLVSTYYHPLYQFIKSLNPNLTVVANPGTNTDEAYAATPTADKLIVFEGSMSSYATYAPAAWMKNYCATLFGNIVYDVPTLGDMQQVLAQSVLNGSGSAYVTDEQLNPPTGYLYDRMPSYWNEEVAALQSLSPAPEPSSLLTATVAGLAGVIAAARRARQSTR
jgi:hypothetical protein